MKFERLSREVIYRSPWVNLFVDAVRFPNGSIIERHHLLDFERAAVTVIIDDGDGNILLVKVPRYTTGEADWELPAGNVDPGESMTEAAEREAFEETGYRTGGHRELQSFYPMNGIANRTSSVVRCVIDGEAGSFDQEEIADRRWFSRREIVEMLRHGTIRDGYSLVALLFYLNGEELEHP
ncbi:MAG: hydrolase [Chlorobi bacterium]|nr:hydrolase [Chlorobiota bacterium]